MDSGSVDLHTHSRCSDGELEPAELVDRAAESGIELLALTDHDSVAGISAAAAQARSRSIRFVPGVEISASWRAQTLHVLGLWIDPAAAALTELLAAQRERRRARVAAMCAKLARAGLPGDALHARVCAHDGVPTRTHLALALVEAGHVRTAEDAFRKYLGQGKRAHVPADWPPLAQAVAAVHAAGGRAVLAHPARYRLSGGGRRALLADFTAARGDALEVVAGGNGVQFAEACAAWARQFGLAGSVGSDYHGPRQTWNPLGRSLKLPDGVVPVWRDAPGRWERI